MFVSDCLGVNEQGHMTIGGMDVPSMTRKYGTPLMIMDEDMIRATCREYRRAIKEHYGENSLVCFAGKAFCTAYMYKILAEESMGADVVSGGEIYTAQKAGFNMALAYFHGNSKTEQEIRLALKCGVGRFVVDNLEELHLLERLAGESGVRPKVLIRVKPGIDAHTHNFIRTGQIDSKFGFALETGEAMNAVREVLGCHEVEYVGLHCHIGSQIFETEPFEQAARVMCGLIKDILDKTGAVTRELNAGGGFGIKYISSHDPKTIDDNMRCLSSALKKAVEDNGIETPKLIIEPGRSIVAPAGITVYTIGSVKVIPGIRTYVTIDGGMTDNPRYTLYEAAYDFELPERVKEPKDAVVTVAGRCCESGDLLGKDVPIQTPHPGDLLASLATGAYCYSMASNYNRVGRPAVIMVSGAHDRQIIRRETYEDMMNCDIY